MERKKGRPGDPVLIEEIATYAVANSSCCGGRGYRGHALSDETLCDCARRSFYKAVMLYNAFIDVEKDCIVWGPHPISPRGAFESQKEIDIIISSEGELSKKIREAEESRAEHEATMRKRGRN